MPDANDLRCRADQLRQAAAPADDGRRIGRVECLGRGADLDAENLTEVIRAAPFRPFSLRLANGSEARVPPASGSAPLGWSEGGRTT